MSDKQLDFIWKIICQSVFPSSVKPYINETACKRKLRNLIEADYSPQEVVDKFVESLKQEPYIYLDIPDTRSGRSESITEMKGSLGHDIYNIQPFGKKKSARLIDILESNQ